MIIPLDRLLDRITMYRLVLYVLVGYVGVAAVLSAAGLLPFAPVALLISAAFLVLMCWAANTILARIFNIPANVESAFITGLILALIIDPAQSPGDLQLLGWAAVLAMASKYILAIHNKHVFNPAAIAVVVTAFALGDPASWWVGTGSMLPGVLVGGFLIVRKLRQEDMIATFLAVALVTVCAVSLVLHVGITRELKQLLIAAPLFFFASIMLTEPLTTPPMRDLKRIYAVIVGFLVIPQIHLGSLYSTPELALVAGNVFAYAVSPKERVVLRLTKRTKLSRDIVDFAFKPTHKLAFAPGQYMEFTLGHAHPDSRGNRRYFTIASSPTEDVLHLGVRFYPRSSTYKHAMYALPPRSQIVGGPIAGDFTLPSEPQQKLAFVAGGVGITPYRSMLKYLLDTRQKRDIVLLYANRTADDIVYKDILADAESQLGVKTVYTLTDTATIPKGWSGSRGRIDAHVIREAVPDYPERTFYLSGPPDMVRAFEHVLRSLGVPRGHIKKDFFPGLV
jgi:glycine betaine catabolism B